MTAPTSAPVVRSGVTWLKSLRSFAFWIVTAILFVSSISMNGAITHLSALLNDRGITSTDAAWCASVLGGSSLLGRIVVGWLLDRFFAPHVALGINLLTALGIFLLARSTVSPRDVLRLRSSASERAAKPLPRLIFSSRAILDCLLFPFSTVSTGLSMLLKRLDR
jgi:fucose permease